MSDHNSELRKAGLKVTLPRVKILEILQDPGHQHISAEDVYKIPAKRIFTVISSGVKMQAEKDAKANANSPAVVGA